MPPIDSWQDNIVHQWREPGDIFSLLLIIGGEIVQKAIAQLAGGPYLVTPVAFSFGGVSYSILTIMGLLGNGKLMPDPDTECLLINARKGWCRQNHSWILARILRDWDEEREDQKHALDISICSASMEAARVPHRDLVWYLGAIVIGMQFVIAIIPILLDGMWSVFLITVVGTSLSLAQASLPQWALEKWSCRENQSEKVVCLTQGNGSNRVIVIYSKKGAGLDLEDLANPRAKTLAPTLPLALFFCLCWLVLLLTATGIQSHAWYLIGISGLGTAHSVYAVGAKRKPSAFGLHLQKDDFVCPGVGVPNKVMAVIQEVERRRPGQRLGLSLMEIFFPGNGGIHPSELEWKKENEKLYAEPDPPLPTWGPGKLHWSEFEWKWRKDEIERYTDTLSSVDLGPAALRR